MGPIPKVGSHVVGCTGTGAGARPGGRPCDRAREGSPRTHRQLRISTTMKYISTRARKMKTTQRPGLLFPSS